MTPAGWRRWLAGILVGAVCVVAQSNRDAYRAAYQSWRGADAGLELDAGTAGDTLAARTGKAADLAAAYGAAHSAALKAMADQQAQNLQWLRANVVQPLPDVAPAADAIRFANREINAVTTSVATFANDPDRAIQQLRQSLERERAALETLKVAMGDRQQAENKAIEAASAAERTRAKAAEEYTFLSSALSQANDLMKHETTAWAEFYPRLAEAARNALTVPPPSAPPATQPIAEPASANANLGGPEAAAPRTPPITPLPLSRYVGAWSFLAGSPFHGSEPEAVDVVVKEDDGHATGTLVARFKLPAGSAGDPVLRFEFSGDFKPTRNQTFTLKTNEGVAGTVDLIPGRAFNELEINFATEVKAGKVHQGDVLLVKQ